jgi:hypothetical protein
MRLQHGPKVSGNILGLVWACVLGSGGQPRRKQKVPMIVKMDLCTLNPWICLHMKSMSSLSTPKYAVKPLEAPDSKALHGYVLILELSKYPCSMFQDMVSSSTLW